VLPRIEAAAHLLSLDPDKVLGALTRLWKFYWSTRSPFLSPEQFRTVTRVDHGDLARALETFGFLDLSDPDRIKIKIKIKDRNWIKVRN